MFARSRRPTQEHQADWYLVDVFTEYANGDYRQQFRVDGVCAASREDAIAIACSRMPVRPNQRVDAYWCVMPHQRQLAITLHRQRNEYNEQFERFMGSLVAG